MFGFTIWSKFGSFRDPLTISQNLSLPIPPKATIAGMMASILGHERYLEELDYFEFTYSVVILKPIRKKSFSQNYINDYTEKVQTHINSLKKLDFTKIKTGLRDKRNPQKPINRELVIEPKYLLFVDGFKYEREITEHLKTRLCKFPFYMGNSEFCANFKWIEIRSHNIATVQNSYIDSFISDNLSHTLLFEEGVRYTKISFATKLDTDRSPMDYQSIILGSRKLLVKEVSATEIVTENATYRCLFI